MGGNGRAGRREEAKRSKEGKAGQKHKIFWDFESFRRVAAQSGGCPSGGSQVRRVPIRRVPRRLRIL